MANGSAKVAAQADLDRAKEIKEQKISLDKQLDQLHSYYIARRKGMRIGSDEYTQTRRDEEEQAKHILELGIKKQDQVVKEANKKKYDDALATKGAILSEQQKLAQDQLQLTLDNFKISDAVKLEAQKNYIAKSIQLSNEQFEVQIKQAAGNAKKQKLLEEEKLLAAKKLFQGQEKLENDFLINQKRIEAEKRGIALDTNIRKAELIKEFSVTYQQSLNADVALLQANNAKVINDDWNVYKEKIKNVNLSGADKIKLLEYYSEREIQNTEATNNRTAILNREYQRQQKELLLRNQSETDELELENLKRKGGIRITEELRILNQIAADKKAALTIQMNEELRSVEDNETAKASIRAKYHQIEIQQANEAKQAKIAAIADTTVQVTGYLQQGAAAAGAISDIANNLEEKKRDKNGKLALEIQKKQFNRNKALGIASAVIDTAASVAKTLSTLGIPLGIPASIAAGVMGALQIAKISSTQFKPEGGGSGGASSPSVSAPSMATAPTIGGTGNLSMLRSQQQLQFGSNKISSLGNANNQMNLNIPAIRVSVVESDITNAQANVAVVQNRASLQGP